MQWHLYRIFNIKRISIKVIIILYHYRSILKSSCPMSFPWVTGNQLLMFWWQELDVRYLWILKPKDDLNTEPWWWLNNYESNISHEDYFLFIEIKNGKTHRLYCYHTILISLHYYQVVVSEKVVWINKHWKAFG